MRKFGQFDWEEICSGKGTSRASVPRIRVSPQATAEQTAEAALKKCFMKTKNPAPSDIKCVSGPLFRFNKALLIF